MGTGGAKPLNPLWIRYCIILTLQSLLTFYVLDYRKRDLWYQLDDRRSWYVSVHTVSGTEGQLNFGKYTT